MFANTRTEKPTAGCGSNVETSDGVITVKVPPLRGSWALAGPPATRMHARLATSASSHREICRFMGASVLRSQGCLFVRLDRRWSVGVPAGPRAWGPSRGPGSTRRSDERLLVGKEFRVLVLQHELRRPPVLLVVGPSEPEHGTAGADPEASRDFRRRRHRLHHLMGSDQADAGLALDPIGHREHRR